MSGRGIFAGVPWWVKWVVVPVIALFLFRLMFGIVSFLVGLLFMVLVFVAVVGGLLYVIRKFKASRSSGGDW